MFYHLGLWIVYRVKIPINLRCQGCWRELFYKTYALIVGKPWILKMFPLLASFLIRLLNLQNYSSIMTVHPEIIDGRPGTLVIESFVVDVPEGNTKDETCYFVQALIRCNLKSLADVSERMAVQDRTEPINQFWWEYYGVHNMMALDSRNLFRDFLGRSFEHHASCAFPSCGDPSLFLPAFASVCFLFQCCGLSILLLPRYRFF